MRTTGGRTPPLTGFVLVTGPPASGKSTLALGLARELGLPLLAKDEIKERLMAVAPPTTLEESRAAGRFAVARLLDEAATSRAAVLDSVWVDRAAATTSLTALGPLVEVHCCCDLPTLQRRFTTRTAERAPAHFEAERTDEELWPAEAMEPLGGPWPVIEVDTAADVDVPDVAARVREALS